jgi:hypothetical protein
LSGQDRIVSFEYLIDSKGLRARQNRRGSPFLMVVVFFCLVCLFYLSRLNILLIVRGFERDRGEDINLLRKLKIINSLYFSVEDSQL